MQSQNIESIASVTQPQDLFVAIEGREIRKKTKVIQTNPRWGDAKINLFATETTAGEAFTICESLSSTRT